MMNPPFYIADTTLRDGEQAPGVVFSLEEKLHIAQLLDQIGVEELEVGSPFVSEHDAANIRILVESGFRFRTTCWIRAKQTDLRAAVQTKADGVNISFPVSDIQLKALGKTRAWVLAEMKNMVQAAQQSFRYVSLGAQDASRAEPEFLHLYAESAQNLGAFRLRIADTVGCLNPFSTYSLLETLRQKLTKNTAQGIEIEFHGHNDLGMATANSLAAIQAGARCISTTVNGLGERAGNAAFEEVIMAYRHSMNGALPYNLQGLYELSSYVATRSGRPLPDSKPITGLRTHAHESGIHTFGLLKDKRTYELFAAAEVGKPDSVFVYGTHSGSAAVVDLFRKHGIDLGQTAADKVLNEIKKKSWAEKREISEEEILAIYARLSENKAL